MASSSPPLSHRSILLLISTTFFFSSSSSFVTPTNSSTTTNTSTSINTTICHSTPFPSSCISSLKLGISITIPPLNNILSILLHSLDTAVSESTTLLPLLVPSPRLIELRKSPLLDCQQLHKVTLSSLKKTTKIVQSSKIKIADAKAQLSAALTNKETCLEGLEGGVRGEGKGEVVERLAAAYRHISNSLSLVSRMDGGGDGRGRRLLGRFPAWIPTRSRRLLETGDYDGYDPSSVIF